MDKCNIIIKNKVFDDVNDDNTDDVDDSDDCCDDSHHNDV